MYRLSNIYISVADSQIFFYFPVVTKLHSCKKIEKKNQRLYKTVISYKDDIIVK